MKKLEQHKNNRFTHGAGFYKIFWIFIIGNVIGWLYENLLSFIENGHFVLHQGLMYGPFIPVYGIGAVVLVLLLRKLKNGVLIFIIAAFLGGIVEFISSYVQQYVFGSVSWNYSHIPFSIEGRTNIFFALFWGILGLVMVKILYPKLSEIIDKIPDRPGFPITWIFIIFMTLNILISCGAVFRMYQRYQKIPADNALAHFFDEVYPNAVVQKVFTNLVFEGKPDGLQIKQ